jgi:hypothetical protein
LDRHLVGEGHGRDVLGAGGADGRGAQKPGGANVVKLFIQIWQRIARKRCPQHRTPGVNVMIIRFGDFAHFGRQNLAIFLKKFVHTCVESCSLKI